MAKVAKAKVNGVYNFVKTANELMMLTQSLPYIIYRITAQIPHLPRYGKILLLKNGNFPVAGYMGVAYVCFIESKDNAQTHNL